MSAAAAPNLVDGDLGQLSEVCGKPYERALRCDPSSDASVKAVALALVPGLAGEDVKVHHVSGGITNQLKRVTNHATKQSVLVRTFGAEGMIDRDIETPTFEALSE